ncbi:hypothetical protein K1719_007306 [Acacia pycnantha]|nr:hypothetical protein K1719_007306 [Acacia pycnantha]
MNGLEENINEDSFQLPNGIKSPCLLWAIYHLCASIEAIESDSHSETRNLISYLILEEAIVFVQTNKGRFLMEPKDIKDLEVIEKEVPEGNQVILVNLLLHAKFSTLQANAAMDRLKSNESTSSAMAEIEKMLAERVTYPQICACENELKEWTCAICQLTVSSESNLNFHLRGRKHKAAACKALNMKTKAMSMKDTRNQAYLQVHASKNGQKTYTCTVCQLTKLSEAIVKSHLQGKKHKAACEALNMKTKAMLMKDKRNQACLRVHASKNGQKTWTCTVCHLTKLSEANVKSHLQGKKHKAACEALEMKDCLVKHWR